MFIINIMSNYITPQLALLIFICIIIVAAIISIATPNFGSFKASKGHTFLVTLIGLGIFITFLFYYSVVELQQDQTQLAIIQQTSILSDSISDGMMNEIKNASNIVPNFTLSLNPLLSCAENIGIDSDTPVTCIERMVLSYKIFNVWQLVLIANNFIDYDEESYITNFLQRAHSKQLYDQWVVGKINFNNNTQAFGDLLFEYGKDVKENTPEAYHKAAEKLISDPRYQKINS